MYLISSPIGNGGAFYYGFVNYNLHLLKKFNQRILPFVNDFR